MNFRAIRVRLTLWYLGILAVGLIALGVGTRFAMRASLFHALDGELEDRTQGIQKFMNEQIASLSLVEIRDEFREHSVLGPGGDLFQVCNAKGEWLYRSVSLENNRVAIRLPGALSAPVRENLSVQGVPVRFASSRIVVRGEPYTVQVAAPLSEFYEALERFTLILGLSVPLLLLAASLGGYWISTRALRPVEEIRIKAQTISILNLNDRLTLPNSGDELHRLSETLNEMLARLGGSVQRMSQFTADASHELRAPVSLIRTTAELALQSGRSNPELLEDMRQILHEAERTGKLIDSLLLLARADSADDGLHKELTDLPLSVREAITLVSPSAQSKDIRIEANLPRDVVPVLGDAEALRRMVFALLDNAVKYSAAGSTVNLTLFSEAGQAILRVSDQGLGISPDDLPHVFDRFWRADKARSRGLGGAGLGLAIAKWIAERHGGTIHVTSQPGKGSQFEIRLPQELQST